MKKIISLTLALTLLAACAVGCGDNGDDSSSSKKTSSSSAVEEDTTNETTEETTEEDTTEAVTTTEEMTTEKTTAAPDEPTTVTTSGEDPELPNISVEPNTPIPVVDGDIAGYWELEKYLDEEGNDYADMLGIPVGLLIQFEFKSDGTLLMNDIFSAAVGDEGMPGTWTKNGDIVTVDVDDEIIDFELKGDRLVYDDEEGMMQLMKVEKFSDADLSSLFGDMEE